jgi:hypothetical protein
MGSEPRGARDESARTTADGPIIAVFFQKPIASLLGIDDVNRVVYRCAGYRDGSPTQRARLRFRMSLQAKATMLRVMAEAARVASQC